MNLHQTSLYEGHILKDRYVIIALLGKGGMGRVYLAQDLRLEGKLWAIKEVNVAVEKNTFIHEAKMLATLDHPYLPKIVDYYPPDDQGFSFIVMDYIKGTSIAERYEKTQELFSIEEIIRYMLQLCKVFQYLHSHKPYPIIYRDLKPTNIMIDENSDIKLIDFGIARLYERDKQGDTVKVGTIGFAAPEQYGHQQTDHRTDIYQFGVLLRYLLTGQSVPLAHNATEGDEQYQSATDTDMASSRQSLLEIVFKATQFNPDDRYQSIEDMNEQLQELQKNMLQIKPFHQPLNPSTRPSSSAFQDYFHTKYVLIGSLWRGAGATTLATNLARCLAKKNIQVAYVEYPSIEPYMFDYLNVMAWEQATGQRYEDMRRVINSSGYKGALRFWDKQGIHWIINDPRLTEQKLSWSNEHMLQLTHLLRQQAVTIIDVSNHWLHPGLQGLLEQADHIYVCVEPNPVKIDIDESGVLNKLVEMESAGSCRFELITMKMNADVSQREWHKCLYKKPTMSISYIPYPQLNKCVWDSTFVYDHPEYTDRLEQSFKPLLKQIVPQLLTDGRNVSGEKMLLKWISFFKKS